MSWGLTIGHIRPETAAVDDRIKTGGLIGSAGAFGDRPPHERVKCPSCTAVFSCLLIGLNAVAWCDEPAALQTLVHPQLVHLRNRPEREWSDFPETPAGAHLKVAFQSAKNSAPWSLVLRQQDVKQAWTVALNGKRLGELVRDENDMAIGLEVPAGTLQDGGNQLLIESTASAKSADDIRVGQVVLHHRPLRDVLSEAAVAVTVVDAGTNTPMPCRITIVDDSGFLVPLGTASNDELAVRPGTAFSGTGRAVLRLPAGNYTVYAGRGFEYSLASARITVKADQTFRQEFSLRREVPTPGYVACDTHVHTLTHSRHGDATIEERMITLAGEGIELPIATDHNAHIDYDPVARRLGMRRYFTPVAGNEVTTPRGHINVFPVRQGAPIPDHNQTDWSLLFDDIYRTPGVKIAILNHARDLHSGVRPFGPAVHNAVVGENLEGWPLRFNGMEVVNSGATQSDVLRLFRDWMGLLNGGYQVTPAGSSDSHDVARHFVGQGRTYIRCDDRDPGALDVESAVNNFIQGRVMVSYGLLAQTTVNERYSSGELAAAPDSEVQVDVRVLGPHWVKADRVMLFANGSLVRDEAIAGTADPAEGVKWSGSWKLPRPGHDIHLVTIAMGPGVDGPYWRTAKPYQPASPEVQTHVIGCSGAIWLDADRDGRRTPAREYAQRLVAASRGDIDKVLAALTAYDEATAAHAACLLQRAGTDLHDERIQAALKSAPDQVRVGFQLYLDAWRENQIARNERH